MTDEEAIEAFRQALNKGLAKLEYAPFQALARSGDELAFKSSMNHPGVLLGWRQHGELYDAYMDLGADHSALAESILNFDAGLREMDPYIAEGIVVPLGAYDLIPVHFYMWDESHKYYRRSTQFKTYMKETGVFDYWHEHGFPPQCRPVGDDDFECD